MDGILSWQDRDKYGQGVGKNGVLVVRNESCCQIDVELVGGRCDAGGLSGFLSIPAHEGVHYMKIPKKAKDSRLPGTITSHEELAGLLSLSLHRSQGNSGKYSTNM